MGTSVSTTSDKIVNDMTTQAISSCPGGTSISTVNISGLTFNPPPGCKNPQFSIDQASTIDATCYLGNLQTAVAQTSADLSAEAKTGLGWSVSTTVDDTKNNLQQYTSAQCAGESSTQQINIQDSVISACDFILAQNATDKQMCEINLTQNAALKVADKLAAQSTGFLGGTGGIIIIVVIIIVIIIVIAIGAYFVLKSNKLAGGGSNRSNCANGKACIIIIILVLIFLVWFLIKTSKIPNNNKINEADLNHFTETLSEARKIAGIIPGHNPIPEYTGGLTSDENSISESRCRSHHSPRSPFSPLSPSSPQQISPSSPQQKSQVSPRSSYCPQSLIYTNYNLLTFQDDVTLDEFYKPLI